MNTEATKEHKAHKSTYSVLENTVQVPCVLASCFPVHIRLLYQTEFAMSWYAATLTSSSCMSLNSRAWSSGVWLSAAGCSSRQCLKTKLRNTVQNL